MYNNLKFVHRVMDLSYVYFLIVIFPNYMYIINHRVFIKNYCCFKWVGVNNIKIIEILFIHINLFFAVKSDISMFKCKIFYVKDLRCLLCHDKWLISISNNLKINKSHSWFIHFDTTIVMNPLTFERWNSKHGIINLPYLLYYTKACHWSKYRILIFSCGKL